MIRLASATLAPVVMLAIMPVAAADQSQGQLTVRADLSYVPISEIEFTNRDLKYEIYDNLTYRGSLEYRISNILSIGPAFEYMARHISPDATFSEDIRLYNLYADFRFNHALTDSGANYFVFGLCTGISSLNEDNGAAGRGFLFYGVVGFDIALSKLVGLDLIYRYQDSRIDVEDRIYRFDGSALQAGLNYRFRL